MAKLKDIKGSAIQYLAEDPVQYVGTWSSGGSLNTARYRGGTSGVTTAGLVYTGRTPTYVGNTEQYNGTSWTELNDVNNNAYYCGGSPAGSYTAALKSSGKSGPTTYQTNTELWDGTNWTEVNNTNSARDGLAGAGSSTSNILAGGSTSPGVNVTSNESWDGTNWTEVGELNSAKGFNVSWGSSNTNAIVTTGEGDGAPSGFGQTTETWNGTAWTETTDTNTGRTQAGGFGSTSTDGILTGGYYGTGYNTTTESWNGTTWTEVNDMSIARGIQFGSGTDSQAGFVAGGNPVKSDTEEWSFPPSTSTTLQEGQLWFNYNSSVLKGYGKAAGIPAATWSSGGNLNTARQGSGNVGVTTAALAVAGNGATGYLAITESYDGSAWTEVGDINTARRYIGNTGSQTSAFIAGGSVPPGNTDNGNVEQWNGSSWTEIADINTARRLVGTAQKGTVTAGLIYMGSTESPSAIGANGITESWNGSAWTEVGDANNAREGCSSVGTQTSALAAKGIAGPPFAATTHNEQWDGTSWTETTEVNTAANYVGSGGGSSTDGLVFTGLWPSVTQTEYWNGSSWTELNDVSTARDLYGGGAGSSTSALAIGGYSGSPAPYTTTTEEWNVDPVVTTVTTS